MSTHALTVAESKALAFLATRKLELANKPTVVVPKRNDLTADRKRVLDAINATYTFNSGCISGTCDDEAFEPLVDDIDYHSDTVEDAADIERIFTEASDSYFITRSHEIACAIYGIQADIAKDWQANQYTNLKAIMAEIYSTSRSRNWHNTDISCGSLLSKLRDGQLHSTMWASGRAIYRSYERFRANSAQRPGALKTRYVVEASVSNASNHLMKWHTKRRYMYKQNFIEMSNAAYFAGSRQSPDGVFELMANAQSLVADIGAGAAKQQKAQKQSSLSKFGQVVGIAATILSLPW